MVSDCRPCQDALEITKLQDWLFALPFDLDCVFVTINDAKHWTCFVHPQLVSFMEYISFWRNKIIGKSFFGVRRLLFHLDAIQTSTNPSRRVGEKR
jgi:hypothetical protein